MNPLGIIKAMFASSPRFDPLDCGHRVRSGAALLVDVREPGEWSDGVAQHAVLLPFSDLTGPRTRWTSFLAGASNREILVYCASGSRSGFAARVLNHEGFRAANTGGLAAWAQAGWPIVPTSQR